jgi:hypothetical protein
MRHHESYAIGDGLVRPVRSFGQAAEPGDEHAITALVDRYYAAAATQDSKTACELISGILREAIPEEYGAPPGPLYLRGVTTCEELLSIVFRRFHTALTSPLRVTGVRTHGNQALALLAWKRFPPGFIEALRERGGWKIQTPLAAPIP